jgi:hypothetical protein
MWYDNSLNSVYTYEQINEYSGWSFFGIIKDGHGKQTTTQYVDQEFDESITLTYQFVGGINNYTADYYLDWANTVESNLEIIKYHVQPIASIVPNKEIAKNIMIAYEDYFILL